MKSSLSVRSNPMTDILTHRTTAQLIVIGLVSLTTFLLARLMAHGAQSVVLTTLDMLLMLNLQGLTVCIAWLVLSLLLNKRHYPSTHRTVKGTLTRINTGLSLLSVLLLTQSGTEFILKPLYDNSVGDLSAIAWLEHTLGVAGLLVFGILSVITLLYRTWEHYRHDKP